MEPLQLPAPMPVVGKRATKKKKKIVRPRLPDARPAGHAGRGELDARAFTGGPTIQEQVRNVVDAPIRPVESIDDPIVARNRGYWKHNQRLDRLEGTLLARLKNDPDPYEKFELQVALAEVYSAQVGTLEQFEVPPQWGDYRADRWLNKLDNDLAIASDKARMLMDISDREAARWPESDPAVLQLQSLK